MKKTLTSVVVTTKPGTAITFADDAGHSYGTSAARSLSLHEAVDSVGTAGEGEAVRLIVPYGAIDNVVYSYTTATVETPADANCGEQDDEQEGAE